jgi:hypothetical protein
MASEPGAEVQLTDLQVIQQFSLAVRGATAPREQVIAALESDLAYLRGSTRAPAKKAPAEPAPAKTPVKPAGKPAAKAPAKKAPVKVAAKVAVKVAARTPAKKAAARR